MPKPNNVRFQVVRKRLADGTIREYRYVRKSPGYVAKRGNKGWSKRRDYEERVYAVRLIDSLRLPFFQAKTRSRERNLPFSLTRDDLITIVERQRGVCALTGLKFRFDESPFRPSLDQREAGNGYTLENCRLVCWAVNMALRDWGDKVFLEIAHAAVNWAKRCKPANIGA